MGVALAAVLAAPALVASPGQAPGLEAPPVFLTGTQAVVLDIVAHDKKGRTFGDLRPEEIEILEEGRPKAIVGFRFVERALAPPPAPPGAPGPVPVPEAIRHPTLVTLVFDALDREGRAFARSAAQKLPAADPTGRIPYVATVATQSLTPGRYEVSAVVRLGEAVSRERAFFTITGSSERGTSRPVIPRDFRLLSPGGSAGTETADPWSPDSTDAPQDDRAN